MGRGLHISLPSAGLFTKCSHFFGLNRIEEDRVELRRIEITGVLCQSAIDSKVVIEFLIRRSQVRSLPVVPRKSRGYGIVFHDLFLFAALLLHCETRSSYPKILSSLIRTFVLASSPCYTLTGSFCTLQVSRQERASGTQRVPVVFGP